MYAKYNILLITVLIAVAYAFPAAAVRSPVKGDPEITWESPLGDDNIEDNDYNRCRIIRALKPGASSATATNQTNDEIFSRHVSDLYAQSVKITQYIEDEKNAKDDTHKPDLSNEVALINYEITRRLADITRRMNIINSFEAANSIITSLQNIRLVGGPAAYSKFRGYKDGKYQYLTDCEDIKE